MAGLSLPRELRVENGGRRVVLADSGLSLVGDLEAEWGGATDNLRVYDLRLEWRNPAGEPVAFRGALVVTNAPGSPPKLTQRGVRGAALIGEIKVDDQPWQPFSQAYMP